MQRKLFATYKSPLTDRNSTICAKVEACWMNPAVSGQGARIRCIP